MAENLPAAAQSCRERVDQAVTDMVTRVDTETFRKMQADMYHCSAKCCENQHGTMDSVQTCVQNCQQPVTKGQDYMQKELEDFMQRIQRCSLQCQDVVKDKLTSATPTNQMEKIKSQMENCLIQCGEKHIALIPGMMKRIKTNLQQLK